MAIPEASGEAPLARFSLQKSIYQGDARIFHQAGFVYDVVQHIEARTLAQNTLTLLLRLQSGETAQLEIAALGRDVFRLRFGQKLATPPEPSPMLASLYDDKPTVSFNETTTAFEVSLAGKRLRVAKSPFRLQLTVRSVHDRQETIVFELETEKLAGDFVTPPLGLRCAMGQGAQAFLSWRIHNGERFFGLGEKFNKVEKSSTRATIWAADTCGTNTTDLSYKAVPVLYSTQGWGMMLHSGFRSHWEVGTFSYTSGSVLVEEPVLDCFFFCCGSLKDLVMRYGELTGRTALPPKWALGVWMSRCQYQNRAEVQEVLSRLRQEAVPCDVVHLDPAWMKASNAGGYYQELGVDACDFDWDTADWGAPEDLFAEHTRQGFKTCLWVNPYLPEGKPIYEEAKAAGYLVKTAEGEAARLEYGQPVGVVDFTNPQAKTWWQEHLKRYLRLGASVFKPDYGDRVPEEGVFYNGKTGAEMHNLYLHLYVEAVYQAVEAVHGQGVVWRRPGYLGSQRFPGSWAGDTQVSWQGMQGALRGGLSAGFTGEAFWSHDIGGFAGPPPSPELYIRWMQFGMLSPFCRFHGTSPREPWLYGEAALQVARHYAQLRYRLIPYLLACGQFSADNGLPILRHMKLEFPDEAGAEWIDDQYMLGPDLLVAPILAEGQRQRMVYFPAGEWRNFEDSRLVFNGPRYQSVPAPLEKIPLFVRPGAVIPTYLAAPMNLQGEPGDLLLEIHPGAAKRQLAWGDGPHQISLRYTCDGSHGNVEIDPVELCGQVRFAGMPASIREPELLDEVNSSGKLAFKEGAQVVFDWLPGR